MDFTPFLKALSSFFQPSKLVPKENLSQTIVILSPHPDDESIVGSLALRLARENGARIINVAVTLGSDRKRQEQRLKELKRACKLLEMEIIALGDGWKNKEKELTSLIQKYQPALILAPHTKDLHPTHIKTGELLLKVLKGKKINVLVAWAEFWGQMKAPNLLVEIPTEIVELQMRALAKHVGEVKRNPYHLRLPAWMMDNVRRGQELIQGREASGHQFPFGVLYRLQLFKHGKFTSPKFSPLLGTEANIGQIFKLILEAASGSSTKVK